jgi:hypothetical protein
MQKPGRQDPGDVFAAAGYGHMVARGQKGYNGVAILSKLPLEDAGHRDFCEKGDARHVAARLEDGTTIHNFYVPAGGDEPDREKNPKFGHKLDFLTEMRDWFRDTRPEKSILVGDLNIAPREDDVWSHKQLLKVVSHTPIEVEHMGDTQEAGGWVDVTRADIPDGSALQLVVLPRAGLGRRRQGPQARSHLGLADIAECRPWQPHPSRRARVGEAFGPRTGLCDLRSVIGPLACGASRAYREANLTETSNA